MDTKLSQQIKNKNQACQLVRVNLQNSTNIINNIVKANQKKQFFIVLKEYINHLYLFPNEKIRDVLYNIEQFKFDAYLQPELQPNLSSSSMSNGSSNSTKSSSNSKSRSNSKSGGNK